MSKTKQKNLEEDPRARMKQIRQDVAYAVENDLRVDLMNYQGDDVGRSIIALQDLLQKEREKHAKAREHIIDGKEAVIMMGEALSDTMETANIIAQAAATRMSNLSREKDQWEKEKQTILNDNSRLRANWQNADKQTREAEQKLSAALQTLKTVMDFSHG